MASPEKLESERLRLRKYRAEHPERVRETDQKAWQKKRYVRRIKRLGGRLCTFCGIRLASKLVELKTSKYCDFCRADPRVNRYLNNLWMRRYRQKKNGLLQEPIVNKKVLYLGVGRPPVKSIIPDETPDEILDKEVIKNILEPKPPE